MSAAQEAKQTCSRCGCAGPLHREDEVEVGCQLAELRTRILKLEDALSDSAPYVHDRACWEKWERVDLDDAAREAIEAALRGREDE